MPRNVDLEQKIVNASQEIIDRQFPAQDTIDSLMRLQWLRIHLVSNGFTELAGKNILDIGCGARSDFSLASPKNVLERRPTHETPSTQMYEPWFCRFAAACGANVIGIDRRPSAGENFTHVHANIAKPETLGSYPAEYFDIVNSSAFLVTAARRAVDARGMYPEAPEFYDVGDKELEKLDDNITKEVARMLKEGGYFLYNEVIYKKEGGKLHRQPDVFQQLRDNRPVTPQRPGTEI